MLFKRCLQLGWWLFAVVLVVPVLAGLLGMLLPAAGYFPALGYHSFSTVAIQALTATPGLGKMVALSVSTALLSALLSLAGCIALLATFFQHRGLHRLQHLLSPVLVVPMLLLPSPWRFYCRRQAGCRAWWPLYSAGSYHRHSVCLTITPVWVWCWRSA